MNCPHCGAPTSVGNSILRKDGRHRWRRCTNPECATLSRTLEQFVHTEGRSDKGSRNINAVLTEDDVRKARQKYAEGASIAYLARWLGITTSNTRRMLLRETWKHVP